VSLNATVVLAFPSVRQVLSECDGDRAGCACKACKSSRRAANLSPNSSRASLHTNSRNPWTSGLIQARSPICLPERRCKADAVQLQFVVRADNVRPFGPGAVCAAA
jgi:hypothetical protein